MAFDAAVQMNLTVKPSLSFSEASSATRRQKGLISKISGNERDVLGCKYRRKGVKTGISFI